MAPKKSSKPKPSPLASRVRKGPVGRKRGLPLTKNKARS